jgi:hypothetical protein
MKLKEYVDQQRAMLNKFHDWWLERAAQQPDRFEADLNISLSEWDEQFRFFEDTEGSR